MGTSEIGWLVGDWTDEERSGEPGRATAGGESWRLELGGRILVRRSWCEYPAAGEQAAFRHDDLLVIFDDFDAQVRALFWDNHGHVIRYDTLSVAAMGREFSLESDGTVPGPRQRLHYKAHGSNRLHADFNLQLPGSPSFAKYLGWTSSRQP